MAVAAAREPVGDSWSVCASRWLLALKRVHEGRGAFSSPSHPSATKLSIPRG